MREIPAIILGLAFVILVGWWLQNIAPQESGLGGVTRKDGVTDDILLPTIRTSGKGQDRTNPTWLL